MATPSVCKIDGCDKPRLARGWCNAHYIRWKNHGTPTGGLRLVDNSGPCLVDDCQNGAWTRGYCRKHYNRLVRNGRPLAGIAFHGEQAAALDRGAKSDSAECVIWPFHVAENGYGIAGSGPAGGAHRSACIIAHGPPPSPDHEVAHSCNTRSCINGRHLRWATRTENMADKVGHGTLPLGEAVWNAKLTAADVLEIRRLEGRCTLREAGERYGVHLGTIHAIWKRRAWKWLKEASQEP